MFLLTKIQNSYKDELNSWKWLDELRQMLKTIIAQNKMKQNNTQYWNDDETTDEKVSSSYTEEVRWGQDCRERLQLKDWSMTVITCVLLTSDDYVYTQREETETQR